MKESTLEHYRKYLSYARTARVTFINAPNWEELVTCVKAGDDVFNSTPLREWDKMHPYYRTILSRSGGWSLADTVCTAKTAALRDVLIILTATDINTAEELAEALDKVRSEQ